MHFTMFRKSLPLAKLQPGDKVAIISPSFAAPGKWPHLYELGCTRLKEVFGLVPVSYPATSKLDASNEERAADIIAAFKDPSIKAVIASLGGDHQVSYVYKLLGDTIQNYPKAFFGFSDNTHLCHHLWMHGVPSFYGASLFTQFAMQGAMDDFTVHYLRKALFDGGPVELRSSEEFNDVGLNWDDPANMSKRRAYEPNEGWVWDGEGETQGISWGGCLESLDEILRHRIELPSLQDAEDIIFFFETSEEMPSPEYVRRVLRAFGELGYLERFKGFVVGRPQSYDFSKQLTTKERQAFRKAQRTVVIETIRQYNSTAPIVLNVDIGHTNPQICLPMGKILYMSSSNKSMIADFS